MDWPGPCAPSENYTKGNWMMSFFSAMHLLRGCGSKLVIASVQYICATIDHNAALVGVNPSLSVHTYLSMRGSTSVWMIVFGLWVCTLKYSVTVSAWKSAAIIHCSSHCFMSTSWKGYRQCLLDSRFDRAAHPEFIPAVLAVDGLLKHTYSYLFESFFHFPWLLSVF